MRKSAHQQLNQLALILVAMATGMFAFGQDAAPAGAETTQMVPFQAPIEDAAASPIEEQYQLQLLQQEVMELRGLVEELQFQVQSQKAIQEDRYLELDRRLQSLGTGVTTGAAGSATAATTLPVVAGAAGSSADAQDEKALYDTATDLIRNRQYDLAIDQLRAVIEQFPDGVYTGNAYYWIGEVYAAMPEPDYAQAEIALVQVITYYPEHQKVPDASFKLGKVRHLMGDCKRGKENLEQVASQYQGKSVGKLAEAYLRDKIDC